MKKLNMETALKRYNNIMWALCYEHNTIGTSLSENTENWNLRDMVAECDYVLSTYYEDGHMNHDLKYEGKEEYKVWVRETGYLKRFIATYEKFIDDMECTEGHCSQYD
jgi:hypothetical protein